MAHVKGISKNVRTGEIQETIFTDQEWTDHVAAKEAADAAEAARDHNLEILDTLSKHEIAFYKLYAQDTGRTIPELKAAVKALM